MRFVQTIVRVAALSSAAFGSERSELDDAPWETTAGQDEFDDILPENLEMPPPPPPPPPVNAVVKIGPINSVPYAQFVEMNTDRPVQKDDLLDHATGVSLVSGGVLLSLLSLAVLAVLAMAGKALLLASGAITIACLGDGAWTWADGRQRSGVLPDDVSRRRARTLLRDEERSTRGS